LRTPVRESTRRRGESWLHYVRRSTVPEVVVVLLQDTGALIGPRHRARGGARPARLPPTAHGAPRRRHSRFWWCFVALFAMKHHQHGQNG
jgi:hypothetical protein